MHKFIYILLFLLSTTLASAQWTQKVNISPNAINAGLNENMGPCLAASGDTLHVVWSDQRNKNFVLYYTQSIDTGKTWSNVIPITDSIGQAKFPSIAVSGQNIHLVWEDALKGNIASFYRNSTDGGKTWNKKFCLDTNTTFWPGVAVWGNNVYATLNNNITKSNSEVFFMKSTDNGTSWSAEQKISNAEGRSEDPAMEVLNSDVHIVWNDNRSGTMLTYYRHSTDGGDTWGPETAVITSQAYCPMVSLYKSNVDLVCGNTSTGNYDIWLRQSTDNGVNWGNTKQLTNLPVTEVYPYLVRDGNNLHLVYIQFSTPKYSMYMNSSDGGSTWSSPFQLSTGSQPFLVITCPVVHAIFSDSGKIYYMKNPTANPCKTDGIQELVNDNYHVSIAPNPFSSAATINIDVNLNNASLIIYDLFGKEVTQTTNIFGQSINLNRGNLPVGMYFYRLTQAGETIRTNKIIIAE